MKKLTGQQQFFYENAGFSYDPKTETAEQGKRRRAVELAEAETIAARNDWYVEWEQDDSECMGCSCESADCPCSTGEPHETLGAVLRNDQDRVLASLWGICGATSDYRRVVEAELAADAIYEQTQEYKRLAPLAHIA